VGAEKMIEEITLEAFKCFEKEILEFRNLTIFTGTNGSGKSSVVQGLLQLALHSNSDYSSPLQEYLNFVSDFEETVNFDMDVDEYRLSVKGFGSKLEYLFKRDGSINSVENPEKIQEYISYSKGNLVFLSADRIGPQDTYRKNTNPFDRFGIYGEYAISYLEKSKKDKQKVSDELYILKDKDGRDIPQSLLSQVNYWLNHILDTSLETENIEGTNQVKARFKNANAYVRPKNIGSGISYISSILIVCLSALKGQVIIIENPEIHLHPKAQAKLGEFLAFVASKGVQIIIETHNDHLINRFRYEVFKKNLTRSNIIIHYKEKDSAFEKLEIDDEGFFCDKNGENSFPQGFYDATLQEIYKINRGR
jgi:predicted ATPase